MIKFSVITASFKRINNLKKLYLNLYNQKKNNFLIEWVVVVEKKDLQTIFFLKKLKNLNIKIIINKYPNQFSSLIKQGIENAIGDYLVVVGDDDYFYRDALKNIYKKIITKNKPQFLIGYANYKNKNNKTIRNSIGKMKKKILDINSRLMLGFVNYYMCPAVFFKSSLVKKIDCFPSNYSNINDYITWIQIRNLCKPIIVKKDIAQVGFDYGTISYSFNFEKYIFMWKIFFKSKNYFYLMPFKIIFSVLLILYNYVYRILDILFFKGFAFLSRTER